MNIVLTNHNSEPLPVVSENEGGWCYNLMPGEPLTIARDASSVAIVGDKPSVTDNILHGLKVVGAVIERWLTRTKPSALSPAETLNVMIGNNGPRAVRVILGDGVTANDIQPGVNYQAVSPGYIEIRELGLVDSNITNPVQAP